MLVDDCDVVYRESDMSIRLKAKGSTNALVATPRFTLAVVIVLVSTGAAEAWRHVGAAPVVRYTTASISRGAVSRTVTGSGTVNPVTNVQVGTYVSGVIQELFCDYNTQVKKGQLCARIDPRPYQTVVDQERANLSTAKAQLGKDQASVNYTKLTYERTLDLLQRGLVPQDTLDSAKAAYGQAQAQIELDKSAIVEHESALKASTINLGYTDIVSPVNGTVVSRNVTMGQTVAASFQTPTLFLIATDLANMQVDANVSESDIGSVKMGDPVSFTVEAFRDHVFNGRVTQVRQAPQSVQNVITYDVVVSAPNPELLLKPGMTATTRIVVDHRDNVVRVPDQALRYAPGGLTGAIVGTGERPSTASARGGGSARVWVLQEGRPTQVPVTIGLDDDSFAEVVTGELQVGEPVVLSEQRGTRVAAPNGSRPPAFRL
jgi:HlyD family secretion protein